MMKENENQTKQDSGLPSQGLIGSTARNRTTLFSCTQPCGNCPYRTDAPKRLWAKQEFERLLETENTQFGSVYQCHKSNGSICVGWLIDQDRRRLPSIVLRLALIKHEIGRDYLDGLTSPAPLFSNVREMIANNFPQILRRSRIK